MRLFIGKLVDLAWPYRYRLAWGTLFGVLSGVASPLLMVTLKLAINVVFPGENTPSLLEELQEAPGFLQSWVGIIQGWLPNQVGQGQKGLTLLVIFLIPLVMTVRGVSGYLNIYLMEWVGVRAISDLRMKLFTHLLNLPAHFFQSAKTGDLISRVISDTAAIQRMINNSVSIVIKDPVTIIGLVVLLFSQQAKLTLIALAIFPVWVVPIAVYARKIQKSSKVIQTKYADLSNVMHESFTGNRIIKAYNLEPKMEKEFDRHSRSFINHQMKLVRAQEIPTFFIEFFGSMGIAILFVYIAFRQDNRLNAGDFFQFIGSIFLIYPPIKNITRLYHRLVIARSATERVFELLDTPSAIQETSHPMPLPSDASRIRFDGVSFGYLEKPVLRNIDLTVEPGQMVALVGSSGSGKTTLANLLMRFYDPDVGCVRVGGVDIRQVGISQLRNQIAVVTQETILFNDSILNNILCGRPGATREEVEEAARQANAHDFIVEKPEGYLSVVGEKGVSLSGGQRQRLAIARAILKNAPILVLDEATSSLDTESERLVQQALERLMKFRTTVCIAHRLSTIQNADRIVVLSEGKIVETGTHRELLKAEGVYRKLYALQMDGGGA